MRTLHANLDFAARIGVDYYQALADHRGRLVGDWLFSVEAFGDAAPDRDGEAARGVRRRTVLPGRSRLGPAAAHDARPRRARVSSTRSSTEFAWHDVSVVGFSSTFQQNAASFALARRLKQRIPDIVTVFGGANFDGEMGLELVRSVDCVDFAVIGEGDTAFPRLLRALATGADPGEIPGVARRVGGDVVATPPAPPHEQLDELPTPDYGEYFERAERLGPADRPRLRSRSSRPAGAGGARSTTARSAGSTAPRCGSAPSRRRGCSTSSTGRRGGTARFRFDAVDNILDPAYLNDAAPGAHRGGPGLPDLLRGQGEPDPRTAEAPRRGPASPSCSPAWSR